MTKNSQKSGRWLPWLVTWGCVVYAAVRYVVFKGTSVEQLPVFVLNKGLSFGGLIVLALSRCHPDVAIRRRWGMAGLLLIGTHVFLSLTILQPAYFAQFYHADGQLTWQAGVALLAGACAFVSLGYVFQASNQLTNTAALSATGLVPFLGRAILALTALHVGAMGYANWLDWRHWPGYLPPITLLSCAVALAGFCWPRRNVARPE